LLIPDLKIEGSSEKNSKKGSRKRPVTDLKIGYTYREITIGMSASFTKTITARAEVEEKIPEKMRVRLKLSWTNQRNETIAEGYALVIPPRSPADSAAG